MGAIATDVKQAPSCLINRLAVPCTDTDETPVMRLNAVACCVDSVIDRALSSPHFHGHDAVDTDGAVADLVTSLLGRPVYREDVVKRRSELEELRCRVRKLLEDPGVAQRTPEWYDARMTMITASDIAQALGCAKFGTQKQFFVKKCGRAEEQKEFDGSLPPLKWGVMFEPAANSVYESLNGVRLNEFGLLRHPSVPFLGASPDGITDDGVMVEIKCPWRRKITGEVPLQYYYQIQGQLEVTGLRDCDYFECEFAEVADECAADQRAGAHRGWARGVFIECVGALGQTSTYRYPGTDVLSGCNTGKLRAWADEQTSQALKQGSLLVREHWWVLVSYCTVRIQYDAGLVARTVRDLEEVWARVLRYRNNRAAYEAEVLGIPDTDLNGSGPEPKTDRRKAPGTRAKPRSKAQVGDTVNLGNYAFVEDT
jgi:putative phage-type endonuclease